MFFPSQYVRHTYTSSCVAIQSRLSVFFHFLQFSIPHLQVMFKISLSLQTRSVGRRSFSNQKSATVKLASEHVGSSSSSNTKNFLILHGLFGSRSNWRTFMRNLSEQLPAYKFHSLDMRNHGTSPHTSAMSFDLMALDVNEYVQDHGLSDVTIMGHSMV